MPEMTPLETIEMLGNVEGLCRDHEPLSPHEYKAIATAIQYLHKIANGELKEAAHGQWLNFYNDFSTAECDKCGECYEVSPEEKPKEEFFNAFKQFYKFCPHCGAKMEANHV